MASRLPAESHRAVDAPERVARPQTTVAPTPAVDATPRSTPTGTGKCAPVRDPRCDGESVERLSAADTVRSYKSLAQVERAFRTLKGIDLLIRPIRHRTEDRVPAHIFLCLLAYYVEWHLRRAWAPLLFEDEQLAQERRRRDPILPATGSPSAQEKKLTRQTADGFPVHSFATLMAELASRARVTYGLKSEDSTPSFQQVPEPTPLQAKAYALLALLPVVGN